MENRDTVLVLRLRLRVNSTSTGASVQILHCFSSFLAASLPANQAFSHFFKNRHITSDRTVEGERKKELTGADSDDQQGEHVS